MPGVAITLATSLDRPQTRPVPPPSPVGSAGIAPPALVASCSQSNKWLTVRAAGVCLQCDENSVVFTAVVIACDGSQIAASCPDCSRLVRPFSWHGDDGLPSTYLLRFDERARAVNVAAWYGSTGVVRSVPAVDPARRTQTWWPTTFSTSTLARAILAHLVGLDVTPRLWEAFDFDVVLPLALASAAEGTLSVETILDWLDTNQDLTLTPTGRPASGTTGEVER